MSSIISLDKKNEHLEYIKAHINNSSRREIAKQLGIGKTTVNTWSSELGFKFKKHTVNEKFFDELTDESAYILGYIFADGNVAWTPEKGYYTMTLTAAEKDKDHLEKIRKLMSSSKPLLYSPVTKSYRLIVNSKRICWRLMNYGVIPKKSLVVKFPFISKSLLKHFIRGVIDGDGSVLYYPRKRSPFFEIRIFSGSLDFCKGLRDAITNNTGLSSTIRKISLNTYELRYCCSRGKKLAEYIYSGSNLFLDRKYKKYKDNVLEENKNGKKL